MTYVLILVVVIACCFQTVYAQSDYAEEQIVRLERVSSDGTVRVHIESSMPKERLPLVLSVKFSNTLTGNILHDVNYDFVAMQNGEVVLSQMGMYAEGGTAQHVTAPLSTDDQVDVMIVLQGIGSEAPYSGPRGETVEMTVVPEFGQITFLVLALAVTSVIIIQKKAKIS